MAQYANLKTIEDVTTSANTTPVFDKRTVKTLLLKAPADCTAMAFYAATALDAVPTVILNSSGAAVTRSCAAGQWVPMPDECYAAAFLAVVLTGPAAPIDMILSQSL